MFKKLIMQEGVYYRPEDIHNIMRKLNSYKIFNTVKNSKYEVYNIPCSFDIETTSFYKDDEKQAIMYGWSFCIYGYVIIGRTWSEFMKMIEVIKSFLNLNSDKYLFIYVHNLSYEFQFIKKLFNWLDVFAIDTRKPIYARTIDGIEFRCSYLLSMLTLQKVGENLTRYNVKKLIGDLDYKLLRHSETPLSTKELRYMENDVRVVVAYIKECIENTKSKSILQIPITNTGYIRNLCRNNCLERNKEYISKECQKYSNLIKGLKINNADEYLLLKRAFQGGFTHANVKNCNKKLVNIASYDFTSAYPYVMLTHKFPMTRGIKKKIKNIDEFKRYLKYYCCVFDITFFNIEATFLCDNYISSSKCYEKQDVMENNGRVVSASKISLSITDVDYKIIEKTYKYDKIQIGKFIYYKKDYLPKLLIKTILELYKNKTELKGVKGEEELYMRSKGMLNSCYGMMVTDICRDVINYDDNKWSKNIPEDIDELIKKYNTNSGRFLFYPWGVFVTAYCRQNLWSAILECKDDYCYSDTDSVKLQNYENHLQYFKNYNNRVKKNIELVCLHYNIDKKDFSPKNIKNKTCTIGLWDFEGIYEEFKTLGAKRYMTKKDGEYSLTVSGMNKKTSVPYLLKLSKEKNVDIFDLFSNNLHIPSNESGKQCHTYLDDEQKGVIIDYLGNEYIYYEKSSVHLEPTEFTLTMSELYLDYIFSFEI